MSLAAASAADEKNSFVGGDCGGGEVARRTDGRLLSKEGIARLVDNVVLQGGSRGSRDELNVIQLPLQLDMQYRLKQIFRSLTHECVFK